MTIKYLTFASTIVSRHACFDYNEETGKLEVDNDFSDFFKIVGNKEIPVFYDRDTKKYYYEVEDETSQ